MDTLKNSVLVIPALNPDEKLLELVADTHESFKHIIIVNDGSREDLLWVFDTLKSSYTNLTVLVHEENKGKGVALKTAFSYYINDAKCFEGASGIVTADADGQHAPADMIKMGEIIAQSGSNTFYIGVRDLKSEVVPKRSRIGNSISAWAFKLLYGVNLNDTQSGLRGFSNDVIERLIPVKGQRFEYETNMLICLKRAGIAINQLPIETRYFPSHRSFYKTFSDSMKVFACLMRGLGGYLISSAASAVTDVLAFYLLYTFAFTFLGVEIRLLTATVTARVLSSFVNFILNKSLAFSHRADGAKTFAKYYTLWAVQLSASYGIVLGFTYLFGGGEVFIKIVVDLLLALVSYRVQLLWVFRHKQQKTEKLQSKTLRRKKPARPCRAQLFSCLKGASVKKARTQYIIKATNEESPFESAYE